MRRYLVLTRIVGDTRWEVNPCPDIATAKEAIKTAFFHIEKRIEKALIVRIVEEATFEPGWVQYEESA